MKHIDSNSFEDVSIRDISIISGIRPAGRTVETHATGRRNSGISFFRSGFAYFWPQNGPAIRLSEGELLFIPKGTKYKMQYSAPSTEFVLVNLDIVDKEGHDCVLSENIEIIAKDDFPDRIARLMKNLELCGAANDIATSFRRKELIYKLFGIIFEADSLFSAKLQRYPQILAGAYLLERNYLESIPVAKLAEASNISISLFRTLFNKQYGMSPIQYRNRLRIQRAATILAEGSCTVSEAAYACGFENIGYFCRYYKRITGETPTETKLRNS